MTSRTQTLVSINPATLEAVGEVAVTTHEEIRDRVGKAREAFPAWKSAGLKHRIEIMKKAQRLLLSRSEEFGRQITLEMGRPFSEALIMEISSSADIIGYYAARAHRFLDDRRVPLHHILFKRRKSWLHFEPLGVLGVITPWNWPMLIPLGEIVPALLSGNCVVFKPSELTPCVSEMMRALFLEAGVPEPVFQTVQGGADAGRSLIDCDIEKVFFTGSTEVGQKILTQASATLKKSVLEMGGSDPAIVCDDADIEYTSSGLVWGGLNNCGQNCNGVERIFVHRRVADAMIERLVDKMRRLRVGNGLDMGTDVGPLASEGQLKKMEFLVAQAISRGAKVLTGGQRIEGKGYFFQPTLILWEHWENIPMDQELFGPILYVIPVEDDAAAIAGANNTHFGLASSVWTQNPGRAKRIANALEAGSVMINDSVVSFGIAEAVWMGLKKSGIGWVHGEKGLDEMVNIKYINREVQGHIQKFWWFPYSEAVTNTMRHALFFLFGSTAERLRNLIPVGTGFAPYLVSNRRRGDKL